MTSIIPGLTASPRQQSATRDSPAVYASCYGNKPARPVPAKNRGLSLLGTPPCLMNRRRQREKPTAELTLRQLTQLIKVLQQKPKKSTEEGKESDPGRAVVSCFCHPKIFGFRCLPCVYDRSKRAG
ncbi:unnamed protein product [Ranitomeya imitator]|uniref:Uncharacterized protein n=1 Tax=Ranitomeya imitator TaxID=111125 RepID=A0ABN9L410_9NEOB|nr:unnamed protein product [Ranitomeya imitator]